ncbi:hypothetical protein [Streptomyces roseifaciens]|uniref:hypothetical protein n=1 Tax=Streptomyces roseifaciens TaxID=1488406 RepID=UPI001187365E|nr:hypothetical protein [Streptomyces roseifaciens]
MRKGSVIELPLSGALGMARDVRWVVAPGGITSPRKLRQALARVAGQLVDPPGGTGCRTRGAAT